MLVSSADETAFEVRRILGDSGLGNDLDEPAAPQFVTTGDVEWFTELGSRLLGPELSSAEHLRW